MSHFYGTIQGTRGGQYEEATRTGEKSSGLSTCAASFKGAVYVTLYVNDDGIDCARVRLAPRSGAGCNPSSLLYDGPLGEYNGYQAEISTIDCAECGHPMPTPSGVIRVHCSEEWQCPVCVQRQKTEVLAAALGDLLNVPVLADPGCEQQLIDAINKGLAAIAKAKGE